MKTLLYKEFKLAVHTLCYIFVILFPFMIFIPNYPLFVAFIYVVSCYPILFLGSNKGQQSNDLLYTTLLPVRKKDIVLARILTVCILQLFTMVLTAILCPMAIQVVGNMAKADPNIVNVGFPRETLVSFFAFLLIGYSITDLIFFSIYYRNGKAILSSTLLSLLAFIVFMFVVTVVLPDPYFTWFYNTFCNISLGIQFIYLAISIVIYIVMHYVVYKVASNRLEKVDF